MKATTAVRHGSREQWAVRCRRVACAALALFATSLADSTPASADTFRVTLGKDVASAGTSGRVILFLVDDSSRRLRDRQPRQAPFFSDPQPVASIGVDKLEPGGVVTIGGDAAAWPASLNKLDGTFRVQAVFKCNRDEGSHLAPGNPYSVASTVELAADRDDTVELALDHVDTPPARGDPAAAGANPTDVGPPDGLTPAMREHLEWIALRSDLLSRHFGRDMFLRCGVALPAGYHDVNHPRRTWPTIYVVPGFGGRDDMARRHVRLLHAKGGEELVPQAVHVVLDPEGPYGHHGYADSACNGPVGTALVTELIPHLEHRFRLVAKPEARFVTGHSSGAWAAVWLALNAPQTFGACWASAPDPVDFHAFQMTDFYRDPSAFEMADGADTPSFRVNPGAGQEQVRMTVRQEIGVEHAMAPDGDSGQQWGAWMAMFSGRDPTTGRPRWVMDPASGVIRVDVVASEWAKYDIARLVDSQWEKYAPILPRIRLAVGTMDSFYLNRAVARLRDVVAKRAAPNDAAPVAQAPDGESKLGDGPGYIWMIPDASHDSIRTPTTLRWAREMREAIDKSGV